MTARSRAICGSLVAGFLLVSESTLAQVGDWTATSLEGAPTERFAHTAVWTGSRMIVWGGRDSVPTWLNTGGTYDPTSDAWTPTSTLNAPSGRAGHTAVWTGSKMIVWGGYGIGVDARSGAVYDPMVDTWTPTSTTNAPSGRYAHTAVWTGSKMIVWGGYGDGGLRLDTGAAFDPTTNTWAPTSLTNAPDPRQDHTAVWTGSKMIVWGGYGAGGLRLNTGAAYDPEANTWTPTNPTSAPSERSGHTAVWTGSSMIVWGGADGSAYLSTGAAYEPTTDSWTPTSTTNAPSGRGGHEAIWTGSSMIAWSGQESFLPAPALTGASYEPAADTWTPVSTTGHPHRALGCTAVRAGSSMIVWGGSVGVGAFILNTGGILTPPAPLPTHQSFYPITPCRLLDTRESSGPLAGTALLANMNAEFIAAGRCGIPITARAVSVNLTATGQTAAGHLRLYPGGTLPPAASSLNYTAQQTRANNAVVALGTLGDLGLRCVQGSGTAHVIIDVNGYYQ